MFLKDICTWWIPNIFYFFCFYSVWTEVKNLQIAITFSTSLSLRTTAGMKRFLLKIPANIRKCINVLCISVLTVLFLRPQWRSGTGDSFQWDKSWKPTWSQGFLLAAAGHHNTVWVQTSSQQCKNDAQQRVTRGGWYQAVYKGKKKTQLWVCLKTELHISLWPAEMSLWLFLWSVCYGLFCADHNVDQFARAWEWCSFSTLHTYKHNGNLSSSSNVCLWIFSCWQEVTRATNRAAFWCKNKNKASYNGKGPGRLGEKLSVQQL